MTPGSTVAFLDLAGVTAELADDLGLVWKGVLDHGRFVGGPEVARFEQEFATYCGTSEAIGVANGTDALELILAGLGIGPGDEVLVPANTFVATAEAVCAVGAVPRFVDVLPDTLLLDPEAAADTVGPRTAAIVAVDLYGQMADVPALERVARRHGLALVEDAAQAHGARFGGRRAGSVGVAAGFSFYPGKNLGAFGDAGAVTTSDAELAGRIRTLANHGRAAGHHSHDLRGRNSRLDSLQAGVLSAKLARLDAHNAARTRAMARYRAVLPEGCTPVAVHPQAQPVHHLAVVQVDDRDHVTAAFDAAGIGWGLHYPIPCHRQPAFARFARRDPLPVTEAAAVRILSLPMSPTLTAAQIDRVACVVTDAVSRSATK